MTIRHCLTGLCLCLFIFPAGAEVLDQADNGFTVRHSIVINADRMAVYEAATDGFSGWWDADHSISGIADNLYIDARPGGCFCERLSGEGGLIHLMVTFVSPGSMLRFTGGLGPLGLMGVNGNMTWEFEQQAEATTVTWNYAVGGYMAGGLGSIAPAVDGVLGAALQRFRLFVETGDPLPES